MSFTYLCQKCTIYSIFDNNYLINVNSIVYKKNIWPNKDLTVNKILTKSKEIKGDLRYLLH